MNPPPKDWNPLPPPPTPPPAPAGGFSHGTLLSRLVVGVLLLASAGLLWWSYYRVFLPPFKVAREINTNVVKLSAEVDMLDRQCAKTNLDEVDRQFLLAEPRLFADGTELQAWLADMRDQVAPQGLAIGTILTETNDAAGGTNAADGKFAVIAATISVDFPPPAGPGQALPPSQRLLQFLQRLTNQDKRVGLTSLTAVSGTNSIGHAVLGVNFWVNGLTGKETK